MHWELLLQQSLLDVRRSGRFVVADLNEPHAVLSTSVRNGGQADHVRHLLNHQSCEGTAHLERHRVMTEKGLDAYHDRVCAEVAVPPECTAVMGTAANMNYIALVTQVDDELSVTAVVTAGVEGNATTAGEPATWRESHLGMQKVPAYAGTINTMLLINQPVTSAALARVVVTMTEGKSAALHRLAVPSKRHIDLATGTGTDQYCIAAPLAGPRPLTSARRRTRWRRSAIVSATARFRKPLPPTRPRSRRRRSRRTWPPRFIAGRSSARSCGRMRIPT